jgi:hypothetical protein
MSFCGCIKVFATTIYIVSLLYLVGITIYTNNTNTNYKELYNLNYYVMFNLLFMVVIFIINHIKFNENKIINLNLKFKYKLIFLLFSYISYSLILSEYKLLLNFSYDDNLLYVYSLFITMIISIIPQAFMLFFFILYILSTIKLALSYFFRIVSIYVFNITGFVYHKIEIVIENKEFNNPFDDDAKLIPV